VRYCGGDVMMRALAWQAVGGYRDNLIAGEEPELCVRLRAQDGIVECIDAPMTIHDAAMTRWRQWWLRTMRSGYAFAAGAALHGAPPERHWVRESRRALAWGIVLPLAIIVLAIAIGPWALLLLLAYPLQAARLFVAASGSIGDRAVKAVFYTLGRFAEGLGLLRYWRDRHALRPAVIIEYK
jgi:GT2 family glycosyltransferase